MSYRLKKKKHSFKLDKSCEAINLLSYKLKIKNYFPAKAINLVSYMLTKKQFPAKQITGNFHIPNFKVSMNT